MALSATEAFSGGFVRDPAGRLVTVVSAGTALTGGEALSGGFVRDADGRLMRIASAGGALAAGENLSGGFVRDAYGRLSTVTSIAGAASSGGILRDPVGRLIVGVSGGGALAAGEAFSGGFVRDVNGALSIIAGVGTNIVVNPGVETNLVNVASNNTGTMTRDNTHAHTGTWSVKMTATTTTGDGVYFQSVVGTTPPARAGDQYTASAWVWGNAGGEHIGLRVREGDPSTNASLREVAVGSPTVLTGGAWQQIAWPYVVVNDGCLLALKVVLTQAEVDTFWVDDASISRP